MLDIFLMKIIAAIFDFTAEESIDMYSMGVRKEKERGGCRLRVVQFNSYLSVCYLKLWANLTDK